ncbi:NAD(P)H-dependent oxidoreductase [Vibrio sp. Isolate30]|uniref:NADPH-dependent FMN reductase n=1 Tax=Vibrio sp. Isolate30 TaxID=2908536 RepID=UPI001EFC4D60|nr:NAD(P)H-dependent oxidoreductase [Vibrio sp. Isolate30]MCG9630585.1 NAD(P)H-dependent oxidoreductase [Vibrio sp. Isolate30]
MKILAIGATNSTESINKQLATYAAGLVTGAEVETLDLNDFEMPIYSQQREKNQGIPELAHQFFNKITGSDAVVLSFAEYNGTYTAAFKNIFDWVSRINMKVYQGKPVVMLATSPGAGGASSVLASAVASAPYFDADVQGHLSIPSFYDNFDVVTGKLTHAELDQELMSIMKKIGQD